MFFSIFLMIMLIAIQDLEMPTCLSKKDNERVVVDVINIKGFEDVYISTFRDASYVHENRKDKHVTYMNRDIFSAKVSPHKNKFGFMLETNLSTSGSDIALFIYNPQKELVKLVYRRGHKTSYWKWIDNDTVEVAYGCGTQCMYAFIIDANTGKRKGGYFLVQ